MAVTANPYAWNLAASERFKWLFRVAFLAASILFFIALPLPVAGITLVLWIACVAYIWRKHHALAGKPVSFQFAQSELRMTQMAKEGNIVSIQLEMRHCRWLGSDTLVAQAVDANGVKYDLLLVSDNSTEQDRHRLAMYYHSGVFE